MEEEQDKPQGLWTDQVHPTTGQHSLQLHTLKTIWQSCKERDHFWEMSGDREVMCKHCQAVKPIVIGQVKLIEGKLVERA